MDDLQDLSPTPSHHAAPFHQHVKNRWESRGARAFVKDKSEYLANQRAIGQAYQRVFGKHFPAMSLIIIDDLVEEEALLEIEATAFIQSA